MNMMSIYENRPRIELVRQPQSVYRMRYETDMRKTNLYAESSFTSSSPSFSMIESVGGDVGGGGSGSSLGTTSVMATASNYIYSSSSSSNFNDDYSSDSSNEATGGGAAACEKEPKRRKREFVAVKVRFAYIMNLLFVNLENMVLDFDQPCERRKLKPDTPHPV